MPEFPLNDAMDGTTTDTAIRVIPDGVFIIDPDGDDVVCAEVQGDEVVVHVFYSTSDPSLAREVVRVNLTTRAITTPDRED